MYVFFSRMFFVYTFNDVLNKSAKKKEIKFGASRNKHHLFINFVFEKFSFFLLFEFERFHFTISTQSNILCVYSHSNNNNKHTQRERFSLAAFIYLPIPPHTHTIIYLLLFSFIQFDFIQFFSNQQNKNCFNDDNLLSLISHNNEKSFYSSIIINNNLAFFHFENKNCSVNFGVCKYSFSSFFIQVFVQDFTPSIHPSRCD